MDFISGENREQSLIMPEIIDDYVAEDNTVRVIEAYINSLNLEELSFTKHEPHKTGRPMYNPKDLLKLYIYGYMNRIRSSRRLENESKRNLEVIWLLCKLTPDHKTIARFRHDNTKALKNVFRDFVKLCMKLGLYGKELIAIDGSKFKAVNSHRRCFTEEQIQKKIKKLTEKIDEYLEEMDSNDAAEDTVRSEKTKAEIVRIISSMKERKELYQQYADELQTTGEKQKALTDSESRLMPNNGKMEVCYNIQTVVDAENKLIVEYDVTNQGNDNNFITPMAVKAKELLETETITAVVDGGYKSVMDITAAINNGIDVHVAGTDLDICLPATETEATEINGHHNGRCVYIPERNIALCPMGKVLHPSNYNKVVKSGSGYFNNYQACRQCKCKCTASVKGYINYNIPMSEADFSKPYNDQNLVVKQIRIKPEKSIIEQRKSIVEHPFGTIKRNMDSGYCLTKGLRNVAGEFALTFLAYNFKRAINILGARKLIQIMAWKWVL